MNDFDEAEIIRFETMQAVARKQHLDQLGEAVAVMERLIMLPNLPHNLRSMLETKCAEFEEIEN